MSSSLGTKLPVEIAGGITRLRFSDSNALLVASFSDCKIRIFDSSSGALLTESTGTAPVLDVLALPGKQAVFSCADGSLFYLASRKTSMKNPEISDISLFPPPALLLGLISSRFLHPSPL